MDLQRRPKFVLVTTARNEGPYFLEWIAYHKLIGFDRIIVFQNDSDDGTDEILKSLARSGAIQYLYNRAKTGAHQVKAYKRAAAQPFFLESDWAIALDMDEFLAVNVGDGTLSALLKAVPSADEILLNWCVFGNSGLRELSGDLVTQRFRWCERPERIASRFTGYKTLFKTGFFERAGVHRPIGRKAPDTPVVKVNGSGLAEPAFQLKNWRSKDPGQRSIAQINHYMVRDAASFVLKRIRGSAHQSNRDIGREYWSTHNHNGHEDARMSGLATRIEAEMARLDRASGEELLSLRHASIQLHQDRFRASQEVGDLKELFDYCVETTR